MKFSLRQILASTAGAVIAAIVASTFGVKGTIVGVAIGSAAATMGTALVAQSIERGHEAVKQVAVKAPETATLLRRLGGTGASGTTSSAPTEVIPTDGGGADMSSTAAPAGETERLEISAVADAPATERLQATSTPVPPTVGRPATVRAFSWRAIAAAALVVFVLALLLITAIELISGKPLSDIFGGAGTGTSVGGVFTPSPTTPTTTPTTTTTTATTPTSSTTTTTAVGGASSTTSTTAPTGSATTTSSPAPSATTTTTPGAGAGATSTTTSSVP